MDFSNWRFKKQKPKKTYFFPALLLDKFACCGVLQDVFTQDVLQPLRASPHPA